jgi:flavin-dependent dehydrogenase
MEEADVAVIGAGPAGATAALILARQGLRVLLVERPAGRPFAVGEGLPPAARALLESLGLWERFAAAGHLPSYGNRSAWGSSELRATDFLFNPYGHGWHLDRAAFDAQLADAAAAAGARRCPVTAVLGWEPGTPDGVLRVRRGDGDLAVRARRVLDCSGRAAVLGVGAGARRLPHDRLVAFAGLHRPARGTDRDTTTLVEAVPDGWWYTALLPGGARVFVYLTDSDLLRSKTYRHPTAWPACLAPTRHVREVHERFRYELTAPPLALPAGSSRLVPTAGAGWLAAGDAAVSFDPLSSQGILTAMATAARAAETIIASLNGNPDAAARYAAHVEGLDREYLTRRAHYYGHERRWPESEFWRRRSGRAGTFSTPTP